MASSLLNDEEDNATRNTQQQQQQQNQNTNNLNASSSNSSSNKMQDNEAKLKKQNLEQRKQELEKLLNEKSWLLQQLQKQETEILNGNFEYLNFNEFISNLALQYNQEQTNTNNSQTNSNADTVSTLSGGGVGTNNLTSGEEGILRRKPLTAKENYQNLNNNNSVLHRRQSEVSNRSSEYDNYPQNDNQSTHSEGGRGGVIHGVTPATQQHAAKAALKKRSATVAGTTAQSSSNLQMIRQQHLEQQQQQQQQHLLYKQQQQQHHQQLQQHYHHPQQHLFKQHMEHQVLMPHLQYATQKFYYTTLQNPQNVSLANQQQSLQQQQQQQQSQYGRYIQNKQVAQQQTIHHNQNQQQPQQHILLTPPSAVSGLTIDNISLYSLNSNNVATLHRPAQQQQPIIVQCDKYYLSPTSHHISHNDGGGFIKSSQNIKEYISPHNSPQHLNLRDKNRLQTSQSNAGQRGTTPVLDIISLAPSYMSMETIDYSTSPVTTTSNMRWRSQTNLPPLQNAEIKSHSSDMLNNNQYYNTAFNPPPPPPTASSNILLTQNQNLLPPPNVTQVKPFKPLDDVSLNSYSSEAHKKLKPKQWLESSLDGPVIRQTPVHEESPYCSSTSFSNSTKNKAKLSSQSLNTARHYSMSSAQTKNLNNQTSNAQTNHNKLSQSTSYLNQMDFVNANQATTPTPSISQSYNLELSPQTTAAYKYLAVQQKAQTIRPAPTAIYVNTSNSNLNHSATLTPPLAAALSPDIRIESPVNMTVVQPATFQPYKEVTKPFEMSDFYKYSTKFRQKENNNNNNND